MRHYLTIGIALALTATSTGCALPKLNAKAEEGRPEAAEVTQISIPFDPARPRYVIVVEPFQANQSVVTWTSGEANQVPIGDKMAAQLITALTKVGNFSIVDYNHRNKLRLQKGERGPFIVRATLTEFNETAEAATEDSGFSLGGVGAVAGIAGAIAGKPGLMWSGAGLAAANPTLENSQATRTGMVAFDLQIVDEKTGRIVGSFDNTGKFTSESAVSGFSLFGIGQTKSAFASSALGQALRMAMNQAVEQTHSSLMGR